MLYGAHLALGSPNKKWRVTTAALAAVAPATPAEVAAAHADDQDRPAVPPLGVSHIHQLLTPQAHPLLCSCPGLCSLAGLRLLPGCCP